MLWTLFESDLFSMMCFCSSNVPPCRDNCIHVISCHVIFSPLYVTSGAISDLFSLFFFFKHPISNSIHFFCKLFCWPSGDSDLKRILRSVCSCLIRSENRAGVFLRKINKSLSPTKPIQRSLGFCILTHNSTIHIYEKRGISITWLS